MESHCLKHQGRAATKRCVSCLKPLCDECTQAYSEGVYCGDSCHQAALETQKRAAEIAKSDAELKVWKQKQLAIKLVLMSVFALVMVLVWDHLPPGLTEPFQAAWEGIVGLPEEIEKKK